MKTLRAVTILFFVLPYLSLAQSPEEIFSLSSAKVERPQAWCGHDLMRSTSNAKKMDALEQVYYQAMPSSKAKNLTDYTLPLVVHIVYENGTENITDEQVLQSIAHLNQAFANTGYYDPATGVNTPFQFCLAKQDPDGNATTGINRVVSDFTSMVIESEDLALKNLIRWNPHHYINIWVVREICSASAGCDVAGYAYLPDHHGSGHDGIVVEARWLGNTEANSTVLIHEMGHYLGLRHTFEGGCSNNNCLAEGDRVCDTRPDQTTAPMPCDGAANSCSTDVNLNDPNNPFTTDEGEHFWNYMDYGDWDCYTEFTQGQSDRMEFFLNEVRSSLLESAGCFDPCPTPILALFEASALTVNAGDVVVFTNLSQHATDYEWLVEGTLFSDAENAGYVFPETGSFDITLVASGNDPFCLTRRYTVTIVVNCAVAAVINASSTNILEGETIQFSGAVPQANSFSWYINGDLAGNNATLNYVFEAEGYYEVYLISANNFCTHRSNSLLIQVGVGTPCPGAERPLGYSIYRDLESFDDVDLTADNGCIIGGRNVILKKDAHLDDEWLTKLTAEKDFHIRHGTVLPNHGGYIFSGLYGNSGEETKAFLLKVEEDGSIGWDIFIDSSPGGQSQISKVVEMADGNFIAVGYGYPPVHPFYKFCFVIKFNAQGEILWQKGYREPVFSNHSFTDVVIGHDGNILISGLSGYIYSQSSLFSFHLWAGKMDPDGNIIWSKNYRANPAFNSVTLFMEIFVKSDGTFIIAINGTQSNGSSSKAMFININQGGQVLNSKVLSQNSNFFAAPRMSRTLDDNILVSMGLYSNALIKMDQNLNIIWGRSYAGLDNFFVQRPIIQLPDTSLLIPGYKSINGLEEKQAALLHVDRNGFAPSCPVGIQGISTLNFGFNVVDLPLNVFSDPLLFSDVAYTTENIRVPEAFICPQVIPRIEAELNFISAQTCAGKTDFRVEICNTGNLTIDSNTPIAFYNANPIEESAELIGVFPIEGSVPLGQCPTFTLTSDQAVSSDKIFAVFNDNGSLDPIFSLLDFPVTAYPECNFINNLDFVENTIVNSPTLDLGPDQTLCAGDTIELNSGTALSHQWNTASLDSLIYVTQPGTYWVSKVDACRTQRDTIEISAYDFVALEIGPDIATCENAVHVLDAGAGYASYLWNDLSTEQTLTTFSPGSYWVAATDACGGIIQHDTINIQTTPASVINLGQDTTVCPGDILSFSVSGFETYQWSPEEGIDCPNCGSIYLTAAASATYTLVGSLSTGCISVDTVYIEVLDDPDVCSSPGAEPYIFHVSPNPNNGIFEVKIDLPGVTHYELQLYNALGQFLKRQAFTTSPLTTRLDLGEVPAGVYWLQLVTPDKRLSKKVLVIK